MPINKVEFQNGETSRQIQANILNFLNERKDAAFTSQEIMGAVHFATNFTSKETAKIATFTITDFASLLHDLTRENKVEMKFVNGRMYFQVSENRSAKCKKCGREIATPKKSWKMAGRPDKTGKRLQLHIGLYECPKHGAFRVALGKRKI